MQKLLTEDEIAELSQLALYNVACMKDWTRDLTQCPVVEITSVKEFIAQHTSVDMVNILFYKLFLLKSIYKYTTISLNLHIIKLSSIL